MTAPDAHDITDTRHADTAWMWQVAREAEPEIEQPVVTDDDDPMAHR